MRPRSARLPQSRGLACGKPGCEVRPPFAAGVERVAKVEKGNRQTKLPESLRGVACKDRFEVPIQVRSATTDLPALYAADQDGLLRWYRYLFLGRGKPSTHVRVLSGLAAADLAAGAPEEPRALLTAIVARLEPPAPVEA